MNRRLSISLALISVAFLFAIPIAAAPPAGHAPAPAVTPVYIVEEFDSSAGFTQTDPEVYISGGQVHWTIRRYEGQQYVYRSIPAFSGDVRLTVRGQVAGWTNNCGVKAGIGDAPGSGVSVNFGFTGGGCATQGAVVTGSGADLNYWENSCVFTGNWLWINPATFYRPVFTLFQGAATLSVPGAGTAWGTPTYTGGYNTLYVGQTGDGDWPECMGTIDSITVEQLSAASARPTKTPTPSPTPTAMPALLHDDFSTARGWIDETGGYFYRDTANQWLVWQTHRDYTRRYRIPIYASATSAEYDFRINMNWAAGNMGVWIGLIEDLDGPGGSIWGLDFTGFAAGVGSDTAYGNKILMLSRYRDGTWQGISSDQSTIYWGPYNTWRRVTVTIDRGTWLIVVRTDSGAEVGRMSGALTGTHSAYRYLMVFYDYYGGWENAMGQIDDVWVYGHTAPTTRYTPTPAPS